MSTFIIDVPMPAMGATVSELTIINLSVNPGTKVAKGQKLAELESDLHRHIHLENNILFPKAVELE